MKGSSSIGESDSSAGVDQVTHIFATICRPDCLHNNKEIISLDYICARTMGIFWVGQSTSHRESDAT